MNLSTDKPAVLIVDDIPENLIAMEKVLVKLNVNIIKASSGNEALSMTLHYDFSLIILDVLMPDMNGYEVAEILKSNDKTDNIPIIFLTAMDKNESHEIKGYSKGAIDFLYKPINDFIFSTKIKSLLDMHAMKITIEKTILKKGTDKPNILIVDDNPINLIVLEKLLRKLDLNIIKANSGNVALSQTLAHEFALIILDVQMPEMDGYEVAAILKSDDRTANIPIIFVTAIDRDETKELKGYDRGGVDFIFKPFNDYILLCKVKIFIEIYLMKTGLEELVAGRTRELNNANIKLKAEIEKKIKAEEALRKSKEELTIRNEIANLFLTVPDEEVYGRVLPVILNAMQSRYGVFGYINENGELVCPSMTWEIWEECRMPDKEIVFPSTAWGGLWGRAMREKTTTHSNRQLTVPEGHLPVFRAVAAPIIAHDNVIGLLMVANKETDYTQDDIRSIESLTAYIAIALHARLEKERQEKEHQQFQEMIIQNEKMLSVGGLAAGMAHEINNPLSGIIQTANIISSRLIEAGSLEANLKAAENAGTSIESIQAFMEAREIPRMLSSITDSGLRVAGIVNNMLNFARKSEGQASSHYLPELLDKTLELAATDYDIKKHYDFKTIEIIKEYEADLPLVPCEGAKIQQVLLNLLSNGAQAMQDAAVSAPRFILRIAVNRGQKMIIIEIEDNGPGMDETVRKRVFEPFFTTKPAGKGTGLGLSVSYYIITDNHNGVLSVESTPGAGTTCIIQLPLEGKKNTKTA